MRVIAVGFHSAACREMARQGLHVVASYCADVCISHPQRDDLDGYASIDALYHHFADSFDPHLDEEQASRVRLACYHDFARALLRDPNARAHRSDSWLHTNNLFESQIQHFSRLLRDQRVDAVLFSRAPCDGGAVLLYALSQEMGLISLIARNSPWRNAFWLVSSLGASVCGSRPSRPPAFDELQLVRRPPIGGLTISHIFHGVEAEAGNRTHEPLWTPAGRRAARRRLDRLQSARQLRRVQARICAPPPDGRYIFLAPPSQDQPEDDVFGGAYADPLLAVEELRRAAPADITICVQDRREQTRYLREPSFFARLAEIPGVRYLSPELDAADLTRNAAVVACIGDGDGFSALRLGKPVLAFGAPWFAQLPGVFAFSEAPDEVLADALAHHPDGDLLDRALAAHIRQLWRGAAHGRASAEPMQAQAVVDAFAHHLRGAPASS